MAPLLTAFLTAVDLDSWAVVAPRAPSEAAPTRATTVAPLSGPGLADSMGGLPSRWPRPTGAPSSGRAGRDESEVAPLERAPGWVVAGLGLGAFAAGIAFEVSSQRTVRLLDERSLAPGDWADTGRVAHARAVRDATFAAALFVVASVAAAVAAVVFAW